ncbi:MAG: nicotinamide mononucleotide transporter family protein, partial [Cellvibrionaceae bacterium]|nr:nicotinamide mononucleotide transporter family protein [Cellvibrionaceae bacterium]
MELVAVVAALLYLLLAMAEKRACWYFALLSTTIYTVIFWQVSLLMESALNVYYIAMAIYGWWQ